MFYTYSELGRVEKKTMQACLPQLCQTVVLCWRAHIVHIEKWRHWLRSKLDDEYARRKFILHVLNIWPPPSHMARWTGTKKLVGWMFSSVKMGTYKWGNWRGHNCNCCLGQIAWFGRIVRLTCKLPLKMTSCSLVWLQLVVTSRYDRCFRNLFFLSSFLPSPRSRYTITLRCCPTRSVWSTIFLPGSLHYSYRSAKKQKDTANTWRTCQRHGASAIPWSVRYSAAGPTSAGASFVWLPYRRTRGKAVPTTSQGDAVQYRRMCISLAGQVSTEG